MKNLTDFRKTLETGHGLRLFVYPPMICSPLFAKQYSPHQRQPALRNKRSSLLSEAPNDNFRKNVCSEDDLRSRIFRTFVVKFLACLLLLGFSNI